jgi:prepilin-type N-terminal cleavage/methylation domain-containing protein
MTLGYKRDVRRNGGPGFTLTEVIIALAIAGLAFSVVIGGYVTAIDHGEWSAYSLAAQSLAMQGTEQARAAKWDPQQWPVLDELGITNYTEVNTLDVAMSGQPIYATNYISITTVSPDPPIRQLRADCVWVLNGRRSRNIGPFTNTAITFRAVDQ